MTQPDTIAIRDAQVITSRHGGHPVVHLKGVAVVNDSAVPCHCYVDPTMRNWSWWEHTLEQIARSTPNTYTQIRGVRFKNARQGLINADARPQVVSQFTQGEQ